ncbi:MAG: hypothetical protein IPK82_30855 [Polyangiaceae bacterium]|nr:hypothetical protein [Polyangiaceae bacterium]
MAASMFGSTHPRARKITLIAAAGLLALVALIFLVSAKARFVVGGAMVNAGYRLQDPIHDYDFAHEDARPEEVWKELINQNRMAASVRRKFPRSTHHPLVAIVACMDARVDTVELMGDTRKYYYVVRTAGSVLGEHEEDMLELAVANGVKVIVLTTHTDCAAEKVAADGEKRKQYPHLSEGIDEREKRISELLARPTIADKIAKGELLVKRVMIDTTTEELIATDPPSARSAP